MQSKKNHLKKKQSQLYLNPPQYNMPNITQIKPPIFNKFNKTMLQPGNTNVFFTVLAASFPQFLYTLTNTTLYSFTVLYADYYQININTLQLVQHAEILVMCTMGLFSSKFHDLLTIPNCYILGSIIVTIFNVSIFFWKNFVYLIMMRLFAAVGYTLMYTSTAPMMNFLIKPGKLEISMGSGDIFVPFGALIALMLSTFTVQYHPLLVFLLAGILGIIHSLFLLFYLPRTEKNHKTQCNFIGIILGSIGMSLIVINLSFVAVGVGNWIVEIFLLIFGVVFLILFFIYNYKAQVKNFPNQIFNRNSIIFMLQILLITISYQSINWFTPLLWRLYFNLDILQSGIIQGVTQFISCCFCFLYPFILKKVTNKRVMQTASSLQLILFIIILIAIQKFQNIYFIELLYIMIELVNVQMILCIQIFNTFTAPKQYAFITGSIVALNSKFGWSAGTAIFTSIFRLTSNNLILSSSLSIGISLICLVILIVLSFFMGTFSWERGRLGFNEHDVHLTHSYDEFTVLSSELNEEFNEVTSTTDRQSNRVPFQLDNFY
ncbi:Major facilitator superfamily protein [Spironucleus salmonicida]|uniref:Major facilitator superfamily protein n=1 Tax=Spironucleus salmonicida TaxID=348837 RepID=V6LVJ9_9EUKA|nr:Major facilitator superfamily protein [Spironucleus salmonicida]KAH0572208.1 Major facilitator superfamily protein [Spironucleus salmonicida]|eukprot:EST47716.1 Major facilitator superfamily protein [Spironucleus salmonicida]